MDMNCNFCLFLHFFVPKTYIVFKNFRWAIIHMDFVDFPFRISKFKNDINYIKYKFSHRFGKVFRWLNMHYSKIRIIFLKQQQPCPFESFKKILFGLIRIIISTNFQPFNYAFTQVGFLDDLMLLVVKRVLLMRIVKKISSKGYHIGSICKLSPHL